MDTIQTQINALNSKIDAMSQLMEHWGTNFTQVLTELKGSSTVGSNRSALETSYISYSNPSMEHKDVLSDSSSMGSMTHSGEKVLAPEVQIQRLTAQLTAAYNRIAALEEQLLAQRIH